MVRVHAFYLIKKRGFNPPLKGFWTPNQKTRKTCVCLFLTVWSVICFYLFVKILFCTLKVNRNSSKPMFNCPLKFFNLKHFFMRTKQFSKTNFPVALEFSLLNLSHRNVSTPSKRSYNEFRWASMSTNDANLLSGTKVLQTKMFAFSSNETKKNIW